MVDPTECEKGGGRCKPKRGQPGACAKCGAKLWTASDIRKINARKRELADFFRDEEDR